MSYKSEINETATEISLFGKITIDKSTGVVTISTANIPAFNTLNFGTLLDISTNTSSNRTTFNLLSNSDIFLNDDGTTFATFSSTNQEIYSDNLKANKFKVSALNTAPSSSSDTGVLGEIRFTDEYIYVCVATNTWKRANLTTWGA